MHRLVVLVFLLALFFPLPARAISAGVIGDSGTDEYHADDNRGGSFYSTTLNWMELLVKFRGFDFGRWGNWGDVRRTGYERNWARSGATTTTLLSAGQHTGLSAQIKQNPKVEMAIVMIGSNDFAFYYADGYAPIYNGQLTSTQIEQKIRTVVGNILIAVDELKTSGASKILVQSVPDWGISPSVVSQFPDAQKRLRVTNVVNEVNRRLKLELVDRQVVFAENAELGAQILGMLDANGNLLLGGEKISFPIADNEPHHFLLADRIHSGTVGNALLANFYIQKFNAAWNLGIKPFSETDILVAAGIKPVTLDLCLGDVNRDGLVDVFDYSIIASQFLAGARFDPRADVNLDGSIDLTDYASWAGRVFEVCSY